MSNDEIIDDDFFSKGNAICANPDCRKPFFRYRTYHIYCSTKCRKTKYMHTKEYKKKETRIKICKACGKEFETNNPIKKYCSPECQLEIKENGYTPVDIVTRNCKECGKTFKTTHAAKQYCSNDCYKKAAKKRWFNAKISRSK